ncbi:MAG: hypothetical protein J1G01_02680 [Clostridiales bacterium]|nr:hypothetical protein [Clostridiales bacterium]
MKLEKHQRVSASISDTSANLSVVGIFQVVQDAVTELMGELHIDGITARDKYSAVWVFVRTRIKLLKNIPWGKDGFDTFAFITSITRATLCIDVELKNKAGERCVYARVEICGLDLKTGKIRKVETIGVDDKIKIEPATAQLDFTHFDNVQLSAIENVQVKSTSIDFSHHTNNAEYVRFIMNTYAVEQLEKRPVKEMEVRYVNQSFENDVLTVCKGSFEGKDIVVINKDDKTIAKSEIVF